MDDNEYAVDEVRVEIHSSTHTVRVEKPPSNKKKWVLISLLLGLPLFFAFFPIVMLDGCMESDDYAMELLLACPAATELLGENIERDWWPGCGNMEMSGNMERTSWMLPVRGSKGSGYIYYNYDGGAGHRSFGGYLEVDGVQVQLGGCTIAGVVFEACKKAHAACEQSPSEAARENCDNLLDADPVTCNRMLSSYTPAPEEPDPLVCHRAAVCCQKIQKLGLEDSEDPEQTCRDLFKGDDTEACAAALDDYRRFGELHDVECE